MDAGTRALLDDADTTRERPEQPTAHPQDRARGHPLKERPQHCRTQEKPQKEHRRQVPHRRILYGSVNIDENWARDNPDSSTLEDLKHITIKGAHWKTELSHTITHNHAMHQECRKKQVPKCARPRPPTRLTTSKPCAREARQGRGIQRVAHRESREACSATTPAHHQEAQRNRSTKRPPRPNPRNTPKRTRVKHHACKRPYRVCAMSNECQAPYHTKLTNPDHTQSVSWKNKHPQRRPSRQETQIIYQFCPHCQKEQKCMHVISETDPPLLVVKKR